MGSACGDFYYRAAVVSFNGYESSCGQVPWAEPLRSRRERQSGEERARERSRDRERQKEILTQSDKERDRERETNR